MRTVAGRGRHIVDQMIFLVAGRTPAHGQRFDFFIHGKSFNITVAVAAYFLDRAFLPEIKALDMTLVIEAHKAWLVMHFLEGDRFLLFPVLE